MRNACPEPIAPAAPCSLLPAPSPSPESGKNKSPVTRPAALGSAFYAAVEEAFFQNVGGDKIRRSEPPLGEVAGLLPNKLQKLRNDPIFLPTRAEKEWFSQPPASSFAF